MKNTGKATIAATIIGGLVAGAAALAGAFSEKAEQEKVAAKARLEENERKEENEISTMSPEPETYIDIADKVETEGE